MEERLDQIRRMFRERFDGEPRFFRAPGRINIIGEHTDYNDGFVMPAAIDLDTIAACRRRADRRIVAMAPDVDGEAEFDLDERARRQTGTWRDYVEGTIRIIDKRHKLAHGADIVFSSTVPIGAGLSSSAALEMAAGHAIHALNGIEIDRLSLAKAGQKAEHEFAGARSGLMDQFASVFGRSGKAMLLDCRYLTAKYLDIDFEDAEFVVCNSGVRHSLASGEYNRRREECEAAVKVLQGFKAGITDLRDIETDDLDRWGAHLSPVLLKRARHVVCENARTAAAAGAIEAGDLERLGNLMFESHRSLRDDLNVSCDELNLLVEAAGNVCGVFGSRMMGGGFGGSTINLVKRDAAESLCESLAREYQRSFGQKPAFYRIAPADGASEII